MSKQNHKIHKEIAGIAIPVDELIPWNENPHEGDVEAIMASYDRFGQVKPIVVHAEEGEMPTVIAGNHSYEAAKRLGWTHIAAINFVGTRKEAIAFALADNRTTELGRNDPVLLQEHIVSVVDEFPEVFDALGWDEFQLAAMEEQVEYITMSDNEPSGYVAPVLISQPGEPIRPEEPKTTPKVELSDQNEEIVAPAGMNQQEAITRGSSSVGAAGAKAVVQYSLVFDNADQQRRWYDFLRWLRTDAEIAGETTAERLIDFLEARVDF